VYEIPCQCEVVQVHQTKESQKRQKGLGPRDLQDGSQRFGRVKMLGQEIYRKVLLGPKEGIIVECAESGNGVVPSRRLLIVGCRMSMYWG